MKVMNMKVAGGDSHAEMTAGYKPAVEDTSTSCKTQTFQRTPGQMTLQINRKIIGTCRRSFTNMPRKIELS